MRHILFTLQGCAFDPLNDRSYIEVILKETAEICKSTLLDISSHKFQPQGVTAVALLAESHISIHTCQKKVWQFVTFLLAANILVLRQV